MSFTDTVAGPSTGSEQAKPPKRSKHASAFEHEDRLIIGGIRLPSTGAIIIALVAVALVLRLWELGERPFHHDESLDAWWSWRFRNGQYDGYDPVYHGPLRFYVTAGFYEVFGESEAVARLFSALTGTAVVGLPWFLRRELGHTGTIASAVALLISPTMLYYSRFGREDAQMVFLTLLAMVIGLSYLRKPRVSTATGLAFTLVCSFAIKESTYLFGLLLAVFLLIIVAAQFDAQNRVDLGLESDVTKLNPAFISSSLLLASVGLLICVVIGAASGELFLLLALYMAGLAAFVLVTALPRLRAAHISWAQKDARMFGGGVVLFAIVALLIRRSAPAEIAADEVVQAAAEWNVNIAMIILGTVVAVTAFVLNQAYLFAPEMDDPRIRTFAGTFTLAGILLAANEYVQGNDNRLVTLVIMFGGAAAVGLMLTSLPHTTTNGFQWPRVLRSLGAIGWLGWSIALGTFAVSWFLFFTVWGERPAEWLTGVTRAIDYWDSQQEVNRGGQPWYYYLYALPAYEWFFVILAFVGAWRGLRRPTMMSVLMVWFAVGSMIIYSYAGERMPWLIAHPLLPMLVLAGLGVHHLWQHRTGAAMPAIALVLVAGLAFTTASSLRSSFPNGADSREILSQAGQATPHLTTMLDRLANIDEISMRERGEPARLAIGSANAWPYSWYLRDRAEMGPNALVWFDNTTGPPSDGSIDVIIVDRTVVDLANFADYDPTLFAMRSWWVPTYNDAGPTGWLKYVAGRDLWEQQPNPNFSGVSEAEEEEDRNLREKLAQVRDGANAGASGWIGFTGADGDVVPEPVDPNAAVEADDGRDGCGSVDQWFLVHNRFSFSEAVVYPEATNELAPLDCVSDILAAP